MNESLKQKYGPWALITGASSGIGAAYAETLAKEGFNLILLARDKARLTEVAGQCRKYNVETAEISFDLCNITSLDPLKEIIQGRDIGLFIQNAGFGSLGPFIDASVERELDIVKVNCLATVQLTHFFLNEFKAKGRKSAIVLVGSLAGVQPLPNECTYGAAKAFENSFGVALAYENRKSKVDILTVAPGFVDTPFFINSNMHVKTFVPMLTAQDVVDDTFKNLGKRSFRVVGWNNRSLAFIQRFLPRCLVLPLAEKLLSLFKA